MLHSRAFDRAIASPFEREREGDGERKLLISNHLQFEPSNITIAKQKGSSVFLAGSLLASSVERNARLVDRDLIGDNYRCTAWLAACFWACGSIDLK